MENKNQNLSNATGAMREEPDTKGPYEARLCTGMPTSCCDYGVVSLSAGRELCRTWSEQDARAIAAALYSPAPDGEDFPQPQRKDGKEPCGECRLSADETCDICGASAPEGEAAFSTQKVAPVRGEHFAIEHDDFTGTVIGHYERLDGKRGVVLQQDGTKVVHVYGEKWLKPSALRP